MTKERIIDGDYCHVDIRDWCLLNYAETHKAYCGMLNQRDFYKLFHDARLVEIKGWAESRELLKKRIKSLEDTNTALKDELRKVREAYKGMKVGEAKWIPEATNDELFEAIARRNVSIQELEKENNELKDELNKVRKAYNGNIQPCVAPSVHFCNYNEDKLKEHCYVVDGDVFASITIDRRKVTILEGELLAEDNCEVLGTYYYLNGHYIVFTSKSFSASNYTRIR
jgi:chaperonin cofactor prefoldin